MRIQRPQLLFSGIVLVSLAAHGLVLQMPWRNSSTVKPEPAMSTEDARAKTVKQDTQAIAITTLPAASLKPKPQTAAQPPIQTQQPVPQPISQPTPQSIRVEPPPIQAPPVQASPQPAPEPVAAPAANSPDQPQPESQPEPLTQQSSPDEDIPEPAQPSEPERGVVVPLGDRFPHFQNSESGCYGLENCHRIAGEGTYRQAGKKLVEQMKADGFQVEERDDVDDQGHRVFAIVAPDEPDTTYFLNVFSDDSDSTIYAVTLEIVSLAELQQLSS